MKIRHNCLLYLPTTILLFSLWDSKPFSVAAASGDTNNNNNNNNNGRRKKTSDLLSSASILEVMNTQDIQQIINQRRHNNNNTLSHSGSHYNSRFALQNDLDDEFDIPETLNIHQQQQPPELLHHQNHHLKNPGNNKSERFAKQQRRQQQQQQQQQNRNNQDVNDFGYNSGITSSQYYQEQQQQQQQRKKFREDRLSNSMELITVPYNDSSYYTSDTRTFPTDSTLVDPREFRGDKILKSSKNALYITKKEYLKKDWCKTEPLVQRIREPGCLTRTFVNRFCYGQCNSFYIPKSPKKRKNHGQHHQHHQHSNIGSQDTTINRFLPTDHFDDEDLTGAAFQSCAFCKPKKYTWITITLRCPSLMPQLRKKRVQRIKQCRCMAEPVE